MGESQKKFQPQTKTNSSKHKFSNHETEAIFATECTEDSSIQEATDLPSRQVGETSQDDISQQQPRIEGLVPELANFAAFDCEWHKENPRDNKKKDDIYYFSLTDNTGHTETFHIDRFGGNRHAFMTTILETMQKYDLLVGYYIFGDRDIDSDLKHVEINCTKVGLEDRFARLKEKTKLLNLYKIFSNRVVQGFLQATYDTDYRGYGLDEIVAAYLQNGEGKLDGLSGFNIESQPVDKQSEYCLQDAQLCMKLIQKNDYELLQILYNISKEVNQSFFDTCNSGSTLQWWTSKLKSINYPENNRDSSWIISNVTKDKNTGKKKGIKYTGGRVLEPVTGIYFGAKTYDVSSMYPSMSIVQNISSETVNCECCKTDAEAKIPPEVMEEINKGLEAHRPWGVYWICKKTAWKT